MLTTRICPTPPGFNSHHLAAMSDPEWHRIAWGARPGDRRGMSLVADGLEATGVDWKVNPALRPDMEADGRILAARLKATGISHLVIGDSHYLPGALRRLAIEIADRSNAQYLTFLYDELAGTNHKEMGVADEAAHHGWTSIDLTDALLQGTTAATPTQPETVESLPTDLLFLPTVSFPLFRHQCRLLLTESQFMEVDRHYRKAFHAARTLSEVTPQTLSVLAVATLSNLDRQATLIRLRGIQAALFQRGYLWHLPNSQLQAWLNDHGNEALSASSYRQLLQLRDPDIALVAVLSSLDMDTAAMPDVRMAGDSKIVLANGTVDIPDGTQTLFAIAREYHGNTGILLSAGRARLAQHQKFLAQQFGIAIHIPRGATNGALNRPLLDPTNIDLTAYRKDSA